MKIEFKKVLIFTIVPAVIAGLFSIAPKLYDIFSEPTAELLYIFSSGPELEVQDGLQKILSIRIINSGKKPLTNISAYLNLEKGNIKAYKVHEDSGLKPSIQKSDNGISVEVKNIHPSESFTISAMLFTPQTGISPDFNLRSKEILGKQYTANSEQSTTELDLQGAILAAISVFVMALLVITKRIPIFGFLTGSKQDILFYITARLNLPAISKEMQLIDTNLTYLRMADILLAHGLKSDDVERENTLKALKCLLLVSGIADISQAIVTDNIKLLEGDLFSDEEAQLLRSKAVSITDQLKMREQINQFILYGTSFLTD